MLTFNEFMKSKSEELSEGFFRDMGSKVGGFLGGAGDQAVAGGVSAAKGTGRALGSAARGTSRALGSAAGATGKAMSNAAKSTGLMSQNGAEQRQYDLQTLTKMVKSMRSHFGKQVLNKAIASMQSEMKKPFKPTWDVNLPEPDQQPQAPQAPVTPATQSPAPVMKKPVRKKKVMMPQQRTA